MSVLRFRDGGWYGRCQKNQGGSRERGQQRHLDRLERTWETATAGNCGDRMSDSRADSALRRIRELLDPTAVQTRRYSPNPCLTEQNVAMWEDSHKLTLPEEYRIFLGAVGNGGWMPGSYTDF